MMTFRFNGVDVHIVGDQADGRTKYLITSERKELRPIAFSIDWEAAPQGAKVFEVFHYAIDRAVRSVERVQPMWRAVYCG